MSNQKNTSLLLPIFGTILFIILYIIATLYYPGGSQVDKNAVGFSWVNNYWCNLLNEKAMNEQPNPAKPIAMFAMFLLCLTLSLFWFLFPKQIEIGIFWKKTIQISGIFSMIVAFFLFSDFDHDWITNIASVFGVIAMLGTFIGLYKNQWTGLFTFGLLNFLLVGVNNYIYYHKELIVFLPVVQKISFITFLSWFCLISWRMYRES
jgi:hypothetical protein